MERLEEYYDSERYHELRKAQGESVLWDRIDRLEEKVNEIVEWINGLEIANESLKGH